MDKIFQSVTNLRYKSANINLHNKWLFNQNTYQSDWWLDGLCNEQCNVNDLKWKCIYKWEVQIWGATAAPIQSTGNLNGWEQRLSDLQGKQGNLEVKRRRMQKEPSNLELWFESYAYLRSYSCPYTSNWEPERMRATAVRLSG